MPKLMSLSLLWCYTNLRGLDFPSLTQFSFATATKISTWDLISFFKRCPSFEFIQISLAYLPQTPTPPRRRIYLAALREPRIDERACTTGLLDHLILPRCTEMMLKGEFTGETLTRQGSPAAQIRPSSIDYPPVKRGITKAAVIQGSCTFSRPSGNLSFS